MTLGNGVTYYRRIGGDRRHGAAHRLDAPPAWPAPIRRSSPCATARTDGGVVVLDPAKVAGKIVVCQRGVTARVNKSLAVMEAGGVGMVLFNSPDSSLNADFHFVPTVHVSLADGTAIKAYAATAGATATINQATIVYNVPAPFTASLLVARPAPAVGGDLLKPDLIAPGQDILAAVAPPGNAGRDFDLYSGTSMSSPHVAGLAALFKDLHPDWSPMAIKSALMTTAYDVLDGPNTNPLVIFRQGAGHVDPEQRGRSRPRVRLRLERLARLPVRHAAACQLLHMRAGFRCYSTSATSTAPRSRSATLPASQTVTRTVTNVGATARPTSFVRHRRSASAPAWPGDIHAQPRPEAGPQITITRTTAALNAYTGGQLTWTDGTHSVRIPMVVRPVALAAPAQVSGSYSVTFGYSGAFTGRGLAGSCLATMFNGQHQLRSKQLTYSVTVPAGSTYARFSLFDANVNAGSDLDLCRVRTPPILVGSSGGGTSAEEVNLLNPAAGTYTVVVDWGRHGDPSPFTLFTWVLGSADAGNMTVTAPASATLGATGAIDLSFSGLTTGTKYLGSVAYGGAAGMPNPTIVRVDTP